MRLPGIDEEQPTITTRTLITATHAVKVYNDVIGWFPKEVARVAVLVEFVKHVVVTAVAKVKGLTNEMLAPNIVDSRNESAAREYKPSTSRLTRY